MWTLGFDALLSFSDFFCNRVVVLELLLDVVFDVVGCCLMTNLF